MTMRPMPTMWIWNIVTKYAKDHLCRCVQCEGVKPKNRRTMLKRGKELAESFKRELTVFRRVLADPRTPPSAKIFLGLAIAYLCMPFDLIPDFIPMFGHLDDLVIVPTLVYAALRSIPQELVAEHRAKVLADLA